MIIFAHEHDFLPPSLRTPILSNAGSDYSLIYQHIHHFAPLLWVTMPLFTTAYTYYPKSSTKSSIRKQKNKCRTTRSTLIFYILWYLVVTCGGTCIFLPHNHFKIYFFILFLPFGISSSPQSPTLGKQLRVLRQELLRQDIQSPESIADRSVILQSRIFPVHIRINTAGIFLPEIFCI